MRLLRELLTTDVGLMSAAGILFMLDSGGFCLRCFMKQRQRGLKFTLPNKPSLNSI